MQFSGAVLLGRGVTQTINSGIVERNVFEDSPEVLMYGMLCALTAAGCWLLVATYLELPVSTTHSIIGCDACGAVAAFFALGFVNTRALALYIVLACRVISAEIGCCGTLGLFVCIPAFAS